MKKRWASIEEAKKAEVFGVLVGLKPGQKRLEEALDVKKRLEEKGKSAFVFVCEEVAPEMLMEFPMVDAYVNTACPRISVDDDSRFNKPVLTVNEALVAIGVLSWEELCRKGLLEN
jgi:2-(3-amino-3-carboxypropyl)histidine synthase